METYCQNPLCENQSVKEVPVSVDNPSDQVRSLCATCEEAYTWGVQHGKMIFPQEVKFTKPKDVGGDSKTTDSAHVNDFLHQCGFAVLTKNPQTRDPDVSFEAWAYKGLLDFQSAEPVVFGLGCSCHGALDVLDLKLAELEPGGNGSCNECLE